MTEVNNHICRMIDMFRGSLGNFYDHGKKCIALKSDACSPENSLQSSYLALKSCPASLNSSVQSYKLPETVRILLLRDIPSCCVSLEDSKVHVHIPI